MMGAASSPKESHMLMYFTGTPATHFCTGRGEQCAQVEMILTYVHQIVLTPAPLPLQPLMSSIMEDWFITQWINKTYRHQIRLQSNKHVRKLLVITIACNMRFDYYRHQVPLRKKKTKNKNKTKTIACKHNTEIATVSVLMRDCSAQFTNVLKWSRCFFDETELLHVNSASSILLCLQQWYKRSKKTDTKHLS